MAEPDGITTLRVALPQCRRSSCHTGVEQHAGVARRLEQRVAQLAQAEGRLGVLLMARWTQN